MKKGFIFAILILFLVSMTSSCGQPDHSQIVGSSVSFSGSKKLTDTPEWKKPGVHGQGKISFIFFYQEAAQGGTFIITDEGSSNFIIQKNTITTFLYLMNSLSKAKEN